MQETVKISELICEIGKQFYGDNFSLLDENTKSSYKKVYENLLKCARGKCNKGILVIGSIGTGKSAMMKIMQRLFKDTTARFKWVNAYELKDLSEIYTSMQIKEMYGYDCKCDLYIDDIGFSVDVKRFGNTVNIITEIILERYDLYISSGYKTHFSSNLAAVIKNNSDNIPTLEKTYGLRIIDRMKEMCEIIIFKGESKRG